ncbi:hypothetical protein RhiXN_10776 [Rhizoctonia solani]|uniref:Uncharacterized protein n=1 Tax=Rhizoctonia solani TaxID=456999 RepID=A0A8H8P5S7_9AGAM|nr:uncharacterized protein RhiXN_10776 [Rhizoctonia solani]QRW25700.1 hypothetical protein RhiXN_10776 [Rhizoctonia solani]
MLKEHDNGVIEFSKYPERPSHTHIDISPNAFLNRQMVLRAKSYAESSDDGSDTQVRLRFSAWVNKRADISYPRIYYVICSTHQDTAFGPGIAREVPEDVLSRCDTLSLDGVFCFPWASRAYHRLTEFRLIWKQDHRDNSILESEFVAILKASPQLRILEYDLWPSAPFSKSAPVHPVALHELETFAVGMHDEAMIGKFLRWIAPGPKPLNMLMTWLDDARAGSLKPYTISELKAFFGPSNVGTLSVTGFEGCDQVSDLLKFAPRVFELAIESTNWDHMDIRVLRDPGAWLIDFWLKTLYRKLICWRYAPITSSSNLDLRTHGPYDGLAEACSVVKTMDNSDPRPVPGWS